ncbi:hypothetical protein CDAR_31641 [Caerostris darwini]|uniref:Uncharacterized protein n=1 Tax=Caerostris darwini TaxID=1538125 RepID=A0AAV4NR72_9ARAC|nr:hypothetical protein CDAR_31641 [Caerostris darwini]
MLQGFCFVSFVPFWNSYRVILYDGRVFSSLLRFSGISSPDKQYDSVQRWAVIGVVDPRFRKGQEVLNPVDCPMETVRSSNPLGLCFDKGHLSQQKRKGKCFSSCPQNPQTEFLFPLTQWNFKILRYELLMFK